MSLKNHTFEDLNFNKINDKHHSLFCHTYTPCHTEALAEVSISAKYVLTFFVDISHSLNMTSV